MAATTKGICYLCGQTFAKRSMTTHLQKEPCTEENTQLCTLLKVEDQYDPNYWLYLDMPPTASLSSLDRFLRGIWLECCGHMSRFYQSAYHDIGKARKIVSFEKGEKFGYDYDFGSTTELVITVMGTVTRPTQRSSVRLLARNLPMEFTCAVCGEKADFVNVEEYPQTFLCSACAEKADEEMLLPVTNSPRMGVCGYCGELDKYAYDPSKSRKQRKTAAVWTWMPATPAEAGSKGNQENESCP